MRCHRLTALLALPALAVVPGVQAADPFLSPPGVAQVGMSGAGVAGPGGVASVWHNPATLVDGDTRVAVEWHQGSDRSSSGDLSRQPRGWLLGASFVNRDKWYGTVATGIAFYTPHTKKQWVAEVPQGNTAFGRTNITTQVIGLPYAIEFDDLGLSLGVVGELYSVDASGTDLRVKRRDGEVREVAVDDDQNVGISGALGFRYELVAEAGRTLDLGGVWRAPALAGGEVGVDSSRAALLAPEKPGGWDLGLHGTLALEDERVLGATLQYAVTDWGDSGTMGRLTLGGSYQRPFGETLLFRGGEATFRGGITRFSASEAEGWMDWPEGTSLAVGLGIAFDSAVTFDFSLVRRSEERSAFSDQSGTFVGLGVGVPF